MKKAWSTLRKNCSFIVLLVIGSMQLPLFSDGLPSEHYVTQRWRDFFASHSPATNPAFMTEENYVSTRVALCPTLQNTFFLMELGTIVPIGLYQSLGASYISLHLGEKIQRTEYREGPNGGDLVALDEWIDGSQNLFMLSYAINPVARLSIGANVNLFHKNNFNSTDIAIGVDLGLSYRLFMHPLLGDHVFGATFQNLVTPDLDFQSFTNEAANLKLSWLAKLWEKRIEVGVDVDIKDFMSQADDFAKSEILGGGSEPKEIEFDVNGRLSLWLLDIINISVQAGSEYIGVCPGLNVPSLNTGRDLQVAYQFMSILDKIDLTSTHTFYFRGDFGKHREEVYARRMARAASVGPTQLYNRARTLYSNGNYWDAFFIFGKILVEYPDFFKNDWVQLHMGLCQENLDMREFSTENYMQSKKAFPRSVTRFHADLGLLRLHYRDNNTLGVSNQFAKLNTPEAPDSLKYHACYYMGLQHQRDGQHNKAVQLFTLIPQNHVEYPFAQFSLAVAYANQNSMDQTIEALNNVINTIPRNDEQKEIANRAYTLLGYIFYEGIGGIEASLSQAVAALRKIPVTSYYYEDAQIGLAWAAFKAQQWADCNRACDEIIRVSKKEVLQGEALLLKGYSAMTNKRYQEAVDNLSLAADKINNFSGPSQSEMESQTQDYNDNRGSYYDVASVMNELGYTGQSSYILGKIDSLHVPQVQYEEKLRDFYKFSDEFSRRLYFARPVEKLRDDIEYALAKAEKMAGEGKEIKIKSSAGEEIEKIEDEMEKLQRELQEIEGQ